MVVQEAQVILLQVQDNMNKKLLIAIIIITILLITLLIYLINNKKDKYDLKIYFFNAGKADAILISKNNHYIMIDTGEEKSSKEILNYFKNNNITKLDSLIITHFDKDHVGSASQIIDNIEIDKVLQSNVPKESTYYDNYLSSLNNKNISPITVEDTYQIELDDISIDVSGPNKIYEKNDSNNSSLITSFTYKNNSFLFTGDIENDRIKDYIQENSNQYDFIKIPYHGKYLKRLDNLLDNTKPKYGVMTCSNKEGCEEETKEVLNNYNIKYYSTNNGSITVLSNGNKIVIKQ